MQSSAAACSGGALLKGSAADEGGGCIEQGQKGPQFLAPCCMCVSTPETATHTPQASLGASLPNSHRRLADQITRFLNLVREHNLQVGAALPSCHVGEVSCC